MRMDEGMEAYTRVQTGGSWDYDGYPNGRALGKKHQKLVDRVLGEFKEKCHTD